MSDLYDSLEEDESGGKKKLSESVDVFETTGVEFVRRACESESNNNYSFYLNRNVSEEKINLLPDTEFSNNIKKKTFLPKIENDIRDKGLESIGNMVVDNQILSKQGLQLNDDGSFTKSPRSDTEELPFITREYRNLQFQKKKTYKLKKPTLFDKVPNKNNFSSTEKPINVVSKNKIIKTKIKEGSDEHALTSTGSSSSKLNQIKTDKKIEISDTITDFVKEENSVHQVSLLNQKDRSNESSKTMRCLKKTKREMNLTETENILEKNKVLHQKKKELCNPCFQRNSTEVDNRKKNVKSSERKVSKYQSDVLLSTSKRNLNYLERHRLKNGYNPLHLGQWSQKVISDTNRSNFGDSVVEELPELPDIGGSVRNKVDEEEEIFYQKLIERDKNLKEKNQLSFRSDGPLEVRKFSGVTTLNSYLGQREILREKTGKNVVLKQIPKLLSIDWRPIEPSMSASKKSPHYCVTESSATASKVELALKAKTYGYLVNARNVFNIKAQAKRKFNAAEKKEKAKTKDNIFASPDKVSDLSPNRNKLSIQKSSLARSLSNIIEGLPQTSDKSQIQTKAKKSFGKIGISEASQKGLFLPQVNNSDTKGSKSRRKVFCQKSSKEMISPKLNIKSSVMKS